jgi:hypothetical protein
MFNHMDVGLFVDLSVAQSRLAVASFRIAVAKKSSVNPSNTKKTLYQKSPESSRSIAFGLCVANCDGAIREVLCSNPQRAM